MAGITRRCRCPETKHEHGTRRMYVFHRCRCTRCTRANTLNARTVRARRAENGPRQWVDADLARKRLVLLQSTGMSLNTIAEVSGVPRSDLTMLLYGRNGIPAKRVRAETAGKLHAVTLRDVTVPPGAVVTSRTARQQLLRLQESGWSTEALVEHGPVPRHTLQRVLAGKAVTEANRQRIEQLYADLRQQAPPRETDLDRARARKARSRAAGSAQPVQRRAA